MSDGINLNVEPEYTWRSPDMVEKKRGAGWYALAVIVSVVVSILLAMEGIWTGIILIVIAALVLMIGARMKPRVVVCAIYSGGIVVNSRVYQFSDFKSFSFSQSVLPKVKLERTSRFLGRVHLPLLNADFDQVRLLLANHLPEKADTGRDFVDAVNEVVKF